MEYITLTGKSGATYTFNVYPIDYECPDESGVYVFTRREPQHAYSATHHILYVGKAESFETRFYNHHKDDCIDKNGATNVCLRRIDSSDERTKVEKDILLNNNTSCNEVHNF